jgi:GNAT superfamily N-acetyltransferase
LKIVPLEQEIDTAWDYLNERSLQVGHIFPLNSKLAAEYFPTDKSYLILQGKRAVAMLAYYSGTHKHTPTARFRVVADSKTGLKECSKTIEKTAIAEEKRVVQSAVFGYQKDRLQDFEALGYRIGASLPEAVSLNGVRFHYHIIYKDLTNQYRFEVKRPYATIGLYPQVEVKKAETPKLKVRGYQPEDRPYLDKYASHPMIIRGIGSGLFEGLYPLIHGRYQERIDAGMIYPLVCEDETTKEPVGTLALSKHTADVMQHCMGLGMYVKPEYQGVGVGTMLMDGMKLLSKRLHLASVWLTVFEGNTPAERLYRKTGFTECGKIPGWLQEGYVNEVFMTLKLT